MVKKTPRRTEITMASGQNGQLTGEQFTNFLVQQTPNFEQDILSDLRPYEAGMVGFYRSVAWDAYTGHTHTYDRFNHVAPDTTAPWTDVQDTNCIGNPCDPEENTIGYGSTRRTVTLFNQSWATPLMCFDQVMYKNKAKPHVKQIIGDILKPATTRIMADLLQRKAMELAGKKLIVAAGMPEFNFTWDAGGYQFLNITNAVTGAPADPTGRLTTNILQSQVKEQYALGAITRTDKAFQHLQLHTDLDTFRYLGKLDPTLYDKARFQFTEFDVTAKEFSKYGFQGYVGDFLVKCLMFPPKFNRVSTGRYQVVLPYKNVQATEGIKSIWNSDYDKALYQFSYINHPEAIHVRPYSAEAINPEMPFLVRDYTGKWRFVNSDLGFENKRKNKGQFIADFRMATQPMRNEYLVCFFHKTAPACIEIIDVCATDPGAPEQTYNDQNETCQGPIVLDLVTNSSSQFQMLANGGLCNGNVVLTAGITSVGATPALRIADFVSKLQTAWAAAGQNGTWAVVSGSTSQISLTGTASAPICPNIELILQD